MRHRSLPILIGMLLTASICGWTDFVSAQPPPLPPVSDEWVPVDRFQTRIDQPSLRRVEVTVSAYSGGNLYLDQGRSAGLQPGDEVTLFAPGEGIVNATIQSVSRNSARCTVLSGQQRIDLGTRGQVLVPEERFQADNDGGSSASSSQEFAPQPPADSPEHPPWPHETDGWDPSQPLLAPVFSPRPEERAFLIRGRLFANYFHTWNNSAANNQYSLGRVGASLWLENPFSQGGGIRVDGEMNRRGVFLAGEPDDLTGPGRVDRLSYYWGGTDDRPLRYEVGRFLSMEFPEFGIIDGGEVVYRTAAGHRVGGSMGFLREPFPVHADFNDFQLAAFYRWVSDPQERLTSGLGFQKTWFKGTPDRDLLIWTTDYTPTALLSVHTTVWGDFYDRHDVLKSTPFEITQAVIQPMLRFSGDRGLGAHLSYVRWPQLLRQDYLPVLPIQVTGNRVLRYGLFTWQSLSPRLRFDGRVDQWHDQSSQSGTSWDARLSLRDWWAARSELGMGVFGTHGRYSSGPGFRISVNRQYDHCFATFAYDLADWTLERGTGFVAPGVPTYGLVQQSLHGNLDFTMSKGRSISVFTDYRFGQGQQAVQAGLFYQKRL